MALGVEDYLVVPRNVKDPIIGFMDFVIIDQPNNAQVFEGTVSQENDSNNSFQLEMRLPCEYSFTPAYLLLVNALNNHNSFEGTALFTQFDDAYSIIIIGAIELLSEQDPKDEFNAHFTRLLEQSLKVMSLIETTEIPHNMQNITDCLVASDPAIFDWMQQTVDAEFCPTN